MKVRYIEHNIDCINVFTIGKIYEGTFENGQLVVVDDEGSQSVMYPNEYEVIPE